MDTITHTLVGTCVAVVLMRTNLFESDPYVLILSIIGSNISDIDVFSIFTGKTNYLRVHRSFTHNLYVIFIFSLLVGFASAYIFKESILFSILLLVLTTIIHVLLDSLNSYGVKLTPNSRWVRVGVINTTDLPLTLLLISFLALDYIFHNYFYLLIIAFVLFIYLIARIIVYLLIVKYIKKQHKDYESYKVFSAINSFKYETIVEYSDKYVIVNFYANKKTIIEKKKIKIDKSYIDIVNSRKNYIAFMNFSPYYYERIYESDNFIKLKFTDLRYHRNDKYFFFNLIYIIDKNTRKVVKEDLSFSVSDKKIKKSFWV